MRASCSSRPRCRSRRRCSSGSLPALRASRADLRAPLNEGARGGESRATGRFRAGLVVAELALSLVLLVGAGLFMQSLPRLTSVDLGYEPAQRADARVPAAAQQVPTAVSSSGSFTGGSSSGSPRCLACRRRRSPRRCRRAATAPSSVSGDRRITQPVARRDAARAVQRA